jgi:hypothetical protein
VNPLAYAAILGAVVLPRQPIGATSVDTLKGVENLMRLREPAAWVALGALVLNLLLALVALATFDGSLPSVAWVLSARLANPVPLVVLTVLVSFCVLRDRTPHARQLTLVSLVVGIVAVLLGLIFALLGFGATAPVLGVFAAIVQQAISVIAIGFLIKLVQLQAVPRRLPAGIGLAPYPSEALPPPPATGPQDQQLQPTWHPDTAAGAAWRTAGDAAAGAPATGWGADPAVGWQPIPTQPNGPDPNAPQQYGPQSGGPQPNGPQFNAYGPYGPQPDRLEPQGRIPNDVRMRAPMPVSEPAPSVPKDLQADQGQRNSQQPALDWWGRPQS